MEAIRRALEVKLAALSQSMIARLIRNHDKEHRLEGFLKITQAAQTDALVRVLDDKLARYLAQVLEEVARLGRRALAGRGRALFLCLAGRKRARAFVARTDIETIQLAEVSVADDLEAPQQRQAQSCARFRQRFQAQVEGRAAVRCERQPALSLEWFPLRFRVSCQAPACNTSRTPGRIGSATETRMRREPGLVRSRLRRSP